MQHTTSRPFTLTIETTGHEPQPETASDLGCVLGHRHVAGEKCKCKSCPVKQATAAADDDAADAADDVNVDVEEEPERWDGLS